MLEGPPTAQRRQAGAQRITSILVTLQLLLMCGGWLYRATLYWKFAVAPGEPYGLGDVLEVLMSYTLIASSGLILATALVFVAVRSLRQWHAIALLACAGVLAVPLFRIVEPHVPQLLSPRSRRAR